MAIFELLQQPYSAPDSGVFAAGNDMGKKPKVGFETPGYFDNITTTHMREGLERLVQDPAFRACVGSMSFDETVELFQRQAEIGRDSTIELINQANEQGIIILSGSENNRRCDRVNIVLFGTFLTDKRRTAEIIKSRNFAPFVGQVVDELGSHKLVEELIFLIPPETQSTVRESVVFEGYSFPDASPTKLTGLKARLQQRRQQGL